MIDQLKSMKDSLINCVQTQISGNLEKVEAKELGEAVDMIKDLSKAIYYCTITEAMDKKDQEEKYSSPSRNSNYYYTQKVLQPYDYANDRREDGGSRRIYPESYRQYPVLSDGRDMKEGRSPMYRKMYMDGKIMHDKNKSMQELDAYMQELSSDLTEMIQDASPEEKQLLQQKISTLASKIK